MGDGAAVTGGCPHFVILTTGANSSVKQTHDRMPLVMETDEAKRWLREDGATAEMVAKTPPGLDEQAELEQIGFL